MGAIVKGPKLTKICSRCDLHGISECNLTNLCYQCSKEIYDTYSKFNNHKVIKIKLKGVKR